METIHTGSASHRGMGFSRPGSLALPPAAAAELERLNRQARRWSTFADGANELPPAADGTCPRPQRRRRRRCRQPRSRHASAERTEDRDVIAPGPGNHPATLWRFDTVANATQLSEAGGFLPALALTQPAVVARNPIGFARIVAATPLVTVLVRGLLPA